MRGPAGWVSVGMLVGVLVGWHGHAARLSRTVAPGSPLVQKRQETLRRVRADYQNDPCRRNTVRLLLTLQSVHEAECAARYPDGNDPSRFVPSPEIQSLLDAVTGDSTTPAERKELAELRLRLYGPANYGRN